MKIPAQKNVSGHPSENSQQEGKSMAPPKFSLQASGADDVRDNLGGKIGGNKSSKGGMLLGSTNDPNEKATTNKESSLDSNALVGHVGGGNGGSEKEVSGPKKSDPPKLEHSTAKKAADGSPNDRTTVGVGEKVVFKYGLKGNWVATAGTPASKDDAKTFVWKAPDRACDATISILSGTETASVTMKVIEPQSVTPKKSDEISYPAGVMGAGMHLYFDYHPMTVSFANVEAGEVSGPATNVTGYFLQFGADGVWHDSGDSFWSIGSQNRLSQQDTAEGKELPEPFSDGGLHWVIPNRFRVQGEAGDGKVFDHMTQTFKIQADGTLTVTKGGESVTRKP